MDRPINLHVVGQHFLETYKLTGNRFSIHIEIHLANFFEFCFLFDHLVVRFVTVVSLESCFQDDLLAQSTFFLYHLWYSTH